MGVDCQGSMVLLNPHEEKDEILNAGRDIKMQGVNIIKQPGKNQKTNSEIIINKSFIFRDFV